jgi:WD40 repeat protein
VRVWELDTGRLLYTIKTPGKGVGALAVSKDHRLATADRFSDKISIWNLDTGKRVKLIKLDRDIGVTSLLFIPGKNWLAVGMGIGNRMQVGVWDLEGEAVRRSNSQNSKWRLPWRPRRRRPAFSAGREHSRDLPDPAASTSWVENWLMKSPQRHQATCHRLFCRREHWSLRASPPSAAAGQHDQDLDRPAGVRSDTEAIPRPQQSPWTVDGRRAISASSDPLKSGTWLHASSTRACAAGGLRAPFRDGIIIMSWLDGAIKGWDLEPGEPVHTEGGPSMPRRPDDGTRQSCGTNTPISTEARTSTNCRPGELKGQNR